MPLILLASVLDIERTGLPKIQMIKSNLVYRSSRIWDFLDVPDQSFIFWYDFLISQTIYMA